MKWIAVVALIAFSVLLYIYLTDDPEIVIREVPREIILTDTVLVAVPDTAWRMKYLTLRDTVVKMDTIYVYKQVDGYTSSKIFRADYWTATVSAVAPCQVDKFSLRQEIYWDKYFREVYLPEINIECPGKNYKFWLGFTSGILVTGGSVYLAGKLK